MEEKKCLELPQTRRLAGLDDHRNHPFFNAENENKSRRAFDTLGFFLPKKSWNEHRKEN